jgi:hypothetical protein
MESKLEVFKRHGWTIECESPYELRHVDGSFASGQAAYIVEDYILTLGDEKTRNMSPLR